MSERRPQVLSHYLVLFFGELEAVLRSSCISFDKILLWQVVQENRGVLHRQAPHEGARGAGWPNPQLPARCTHAV